MSALIPALAEAVKDALNAASLADEYTIKITAVRKWLPKVDLGKLGRDVKVLVVAKKIETAILTRADDMETVGIDVGLYKLLSDVEDPETEADEVFQLIDQMHGTLRQRFSLGSGVFASYAGRSSDPIFDVALLEESQVLRCATTYSYRVPRLVT